MNRKVKFSVTVPISAVIVYLRGFASQFPKVTKLHYSVLDFTLNYEYRAHGYANP